MPQKLNKAGKMQDYIPAGNGDPSGEYGTSNGTNKNFTTSDKKESKANVITENKSVVVEKAKPKIIPYKEWIKKDGNKERLEKGVEKWVENKGKKTIYKGDLEQQEKSLKNRIENLEGVIKNIENGDPTGAEDLQDMKRRLKNYKEDYERQFGKDSNRLRKILEERNRNEDIDHAIDTDYFGFGSLDKLEEAHKNNYGKSKANIIDGDLTKVFGENEKYDKSYSNNPKLEEKLKSNIVEKLNEEFKGKSDEYIRQNGFTIAKVIASSEIRKDEFKDLKFNSFGSDSSNFDNMVRASLEQRKDLSGKKEYQLDDGLIRQANYSSNFYEAGDSIKKQYDRFLKEIDNFNLSDEEKTKAKTKLQQLGNEALRTQAKNISWGVSGRGNLNVNRVHKNSDTAMNKRAEFENYFNELKSNEEKKIRQAQAKTEQQQYIEAYKKANETGALEMTVNGKTYVRSRKTSRTWYEKR